MSHLGRPAGEGFEESSFSPPSRLAPGGALVLSRSRKTMVGEDAQGKTAALREGDVLLLENLRFDKREKKNDPAFCEELAAR